MEEKEMSKWAFINWLLFTLCCCFVVIKFWINFDKKAKMYWESLNNKYNISQFDYCVERSKEFDWVFSIEIFNLCMEQKF